MASLSKFFPLLALFVVVAIAAVVGYAIYTVVAEIADKTQQKMEQKNVVFTKDGMVVGVKEVRTEKYVDKAESMLVKAWNLSTWPAYKSRFWNKEKPQPQPQSQTWPQPPPRTSSSSQSQARTPYSR
ncbi:MAG: hypothetical protein FRX48_04839 [Lasallia pustulata]|uniref:Uncharacterized protein n=1 Tax=Lasallia pustulata TaxID=136370 RepID=A0A5M8PRE4_9LECA|nr:MAG: hypothetical protein FRX48_04839 [Lasallia pustulata]